MKGINFMIEVAISLLLLSSSLILLYRNYQKTEIIEKQKFETFNSLFNLDKKNQLRNYALENDVNSIQNILSKTLKFNFYVVLFNKTTNTTIIPDIKSNDTVIVDYHISGIYGEYSPRIIKVFLWS